MTDVLEQDARDTLYITDAELIRRVGPEKVTREAIHELDRNKYSGFPQKDKLFGGRRYWPAVKAWLDHRNGLKVDDKPPRRDRP